MKEKLTVKDIKSLRDVKYTDFIKFTELIRLSEDMGNPEEFLLYKALDIFYDIDRKTARKLVFEQTEELMRRVHAILDEEPKLQNLIIMDGVEYGLIPDFGKIETGELIDLEDLYKETKWIEIFSILYRPIEGEINKKGEYRIKEYEGYDDKFKDIDAYTALGCIGFFLKSFQILKNIILISTEKKKKK